MYGKGRHSSTPITPVLRSSNLYHSTALEVGFTVLYYKCFGAVIFLALYVYSRPKVLTDLGHVVVALEPNNELSYLFIYRPHLH